MGAIVLGVLSAVADVVIWPLVVGVAVGVLAGSAWLGGLAAAGTLLAMFVWRNYIRPSRPPPDIRPPHF